MRSPNTNMKIQPATDLSYFPVNPYTKYPIFAPASPAQRRMLDAVYGHTKSQFAYWWAFTTEAARQCGLTAALRFWLPFVLLAPLVIAGRPICAALEPESPPTRITHSSQPDHINVVIPKPKREIIEKSDATFTIQFHGCRENNLHHVSCQFTMENGEERWLYIPGLELKASH
jgi:hypothetical protein